MLRCVIATTTIEDMRDDRELHVIVGAGQIGPLLAGILVQRGKRVRLVRRGAPRGGPAGAEWARGDITDRAFAAEATRGAAVVYNCANPPGYHTWARVLPPLHRAVREAAARAGARLVVLDNLYMYGAPGEGGVLREGQPMRPNSDKGRLRAELATELFEAHARGDVRATSGRASDFFGPGTGAMSFLGAGALERLARGKGVVVVGDPDQPHAFSDSVDVAEGLAVLGARDEALGRAWHLPVAWQGTTRGLVERFAAALGVRARLVRVPRWVLRGAGLVVPMLGALVEMLYQWEEPWLVDDAPFRTAFGVAPTPIDVAVARTLAEKPGLFAKTSELLNTVPH
jgi:nucleoside-diphosphate-sugar epimerase